MKYKAKPLPPVDLPELRQVGKPLRRVDALGKAVGATVYGADFSMPHMLHAKVFRSTEPSARIKRLDVSKARALPGVVCVLTSEDAPGAKLTTDMPGQTGRAARAGSDAPVLAGDVVRFVGEPIALVAAETLALAERALELIEIEYEPLPGVFDPIEALKPGAPVIFEPDNVVARWKIRKGNVEAGFAVADVIVENTYRMPFVEHVYLELESGVAWVDEQGVINIRAGTQVIEHFRNIARAVGVPQNKIRVRGTLVGGGFGGKEDITVEIFLALLAKNVHRPVKLVYTREESFIAQSKRHPFIITHRTGVKKNGRITAAEIEMIADSGAYPYLSPYVLLYATIMASGPYRIDNLHVDSVVAATNQPFTSAFRGFGGPQACIAYEQQMDEIAHALNMDPLDVRRVNYIKTGEQNGTGQVIKSATWLEESATRALEALGEKTPDTDTIKVGWGFASYFQSYGRITWFHDTSRAWVGVEMDGTVVIRCGAPDIGAGQINSLCQITAEILGVPLDDVTVYSTDSAVTPLAGTSTATRQLYMSGSATFQAASAVREVLLDRASKHFEEQPENLDLADSKVFVKSNPENSLPLKELVARCASEGLPLSNLALFTAPFTDGIDPETGQGDVFPDFTFGTQAVEVAVDTETGEITLLKSVACHDIGRAINPAAVVGQIAGGSHQGLGYALTEDYVMEKGVTKTPSLAEYLVPTSLDFPTTQVIILESGSGVGPFGAKGIGEPALTPAAPAVANAVADAIGVRIHELPLTPKRVLAALERNRLESRD
ncbi:MAG: xanthine dehydrogenase family protein molybdopterin-binding subunit [Chloroflexi bacterium]|nr:MAG: xanthine dehydrogenase family protein molybdopterin-binding subunit [Chloroflexota bacterium]RLC81240.1 MAG: xanthine dehydrogenase family protein molybdopterin-binding subunit [Chloroflexota bacterium]